ncbi:hypothetical protein AKJ57_06030, partial [candidate division MSBL1 archaeon SCGC-AAA259A05]
AEDIEADAILTLTESGRTYNFLRKKIKNMDVIAFTPNEDTYKELNEDPEAKAIDFTVRDPSRTGQIRHAVWRSLNDGLLSTKDVVVCLTGEIGSSKGTDTISVYLISEAESTLAGVIESDPVMNSIVEISTELGWKGREGEPVGTAFMVGDVDKVMSLSHQLGLNPFKGYEGIDVTDHSNWELIKRYAFLDGAFVLDGEGRLVAAGRYLNANVEVDLPSGLGTRHIAVASMTAATHSRGVTVSGTDGVIRIFSDGKILGEIDPRSRMLKEISI